MEICHHASVVTELETLPNSKVYERTKSESPNLPLCNPCTFLDYAFSVAAIEILNKKVFDQPFSLFPSSDYGSQT